MEEAEKNEKILIVDDSITSRKLISNMCIELGYNVITAENGLEGIEKASQIHPDIILMDILMPNMNGFEATEKLKSDDQTRLIPVIIVTSLDDESNILTAIEKGANDFISKPVNPYELSLRIRNNLSVKVSHKSLKDNNELLEIEVAKRSLELMKAFEELNRSYQDIRESSIEMIQKLNVAAEYKDKGSRGHIKRVCLYARELAQTLGMSKEFVDQIYHASPMHDIGKVGVPDEILSKKGKLSPEEREIMKSHTTIGGNILSGSKSPYLRMAEEIALTHHETWTGKGYPKGLKGEEIPLAGRIVNIVDQYDALRSQRPFKITLHHETVIKIITEGDGRTSPHDFDPEVLSAFKQITTKLDEIYCEHSED